MILLPTYSYVHLDLFNPPSNMSSFKTFREESYKFRCLESVISDCRKANIEKSPVSVETETVFVHLFASF